MCRPIIFPPLLPLERPASTRGLFTYNWAIYLPVGSATQRVRVEKTGQYEIPGELADIAFSSGCRKEHLVDRGKPRCRDLSHDSWLFPSLLSLGPLTSVFRPVKYSNTSVSLTLWLQAPKGSDRWPQGRSRCGAKQAYLLVWTSILTFLSLSFLIFYMGLVVLLRDGFKGIITQKLSVWLGI